MLETKFKVAMWLTVLFMASLPIMGILRGTKLTPFEQESPSSSQEEGSVSDSTISGYANDQPIPEEMVLIPAGSFVRGTHAGGVR